MSSDDSNMERRSDICVIFNPAAGRGEAVRRLRRLERSLAGRVDWKPTAHAGQALELARQAALDGYRVVAAAGGDGTVHEVANGILQANRPDVHFGILPIGSANDYVASLEHETRNGKAAHLARRVDVGIVRAPDGREKFFVCCLGLGLNGAVTLEARKIRRLRGVLLYGVATVKALWYRYATPRLTISFDDLPALEAPTLMLSVLVGRREGGFVFAPNALMDDGVFDYVHAQDLSRWEVLKFMPRLALFGPPADHPKVRLGRCRKLRLSSDAPLVIHLDGEFFCVPEENVRAIEVEMRPLALTVLPRLG
jgi:diacylglycerol kinase (ATP)